MFFNSMCSGGCTLFVLLAVLLPKVGCKWIDTLRATGEIYTSTQKFPWICAVTRYSVFISTCTIIHKRYVIVSVDSLRYEDPDSKSIYYLEDIVRWHIHAGIEESSQIRAPINIYIPNVTEIGTTTKDFSFVKNPKNLDGIGQDVYGVALNLGLVEITAPFQWSTSVSPVPIAPSGSTEQQMKKIINDLKKQNEQNMVAQHTCIVGSWQKFDSTLITTEVVYIPNQPCKEAYCIHDRAACLKFPKFEYLMCYKSLLFMDLCPNARGAALYCESINKRVIGILTTAVNCGANNLPCVYTSIDYVARFFRIVTGEEMERP